jgi:hypothetical protein
MNTTDSEQLNGPTEAKDVAGGDCAGTTGSEDLRRRKVPCPRCGRRNGWKQNGALVYCQPCNWWFEGAPPEYLSEKPVVIVGLETLAVLFQGGNVNLDNALLMPDDGIRMAAVAAMNTKSPAMQEPQNDQGHLSQPGADAATQKDSE